MDLSQTTNDVNGAYMFMCKVILPCSVGVINWQRSCHIDRMSKIAKVIDEGFCILVLNNYWDKWWKIVEGCDKETIKSAKVKWTEDGNGAGAVLNGGWSPTGRNEFGRLCKMLGDERKSKDASVRATRRKFEIELRKYYVEMKGGEAGKKKPERAVNPGLEFENYMHGFGDDDGSVNTSASMEEEATNEGETVEEVATNDGATVESRYASMEVTNSDGV